MSEPRTPEEAELLELRRNIEFGLDVQQWLRQDPIGRYLLRRAEHDRTEALEELAEINHADYKRILAVQTKARIPALFTQWLEDAIAFGRNAETEFQNRHDEAGN